MGSLLLSTQQGHVLKCRREGQFLCHLYRLISPIFYFQQADKLGCRSFISPSDVVEGVYKLNLAFVANLFNNHPAMDASNLPNLEDYVNVEESREERSKF